LFKDVSIRFRTVTLSGKQMTGDAYSMKTVVRFILYVLFNARHFPSGSRTCDHENHGRVFPLNAPV